MISIGSSQKSRIVMENICVRLQFNTQCYGLKEKMMTKEENWTGKVISKTAKLI